MTASGAAEEPGHPPHRLARFRDRVAVGVVDQGVSSVGNLAAALVGARYLSAHDFGAYATGTAVCLVVHGIIRSLVTEPALVDTPPGRPERRQVLQTSVALGLMSAAIVLLGALFTTDPTRGVLLAFALVLPAMLVHDCGRYLAFSMKRPELALGLDVVWTVVELVVLGLLVTTSSLTAASLALTWGGTAALSAVVVLVRLRVAIPSLAWLFRARELSWRFAAEWSSWAGAAQFAQVGLGWVVGVAAVGAFSATQVLFGPLNILYLGAIAVLMPEGHEMERDRFKRNLIAMSLLLAGIALATTVAGLFIPDSIGRQVFGDTWALAHDLVLPSGLVIVFSAANAGAIAGLRSMRAIEASLSTRLRIAPGVLVLPLGCAAIWGVNGFVRALAVWVALSTVIWWRTFLRELRQEDPGRRRATSWDVGPAHSALAGAAGTDLDVDLPGSADPASSETGLV